jgi:hypothetical protein
MSTTQLRDLYARVHGRATTSRNREFLIRKICDAEAAAREAVAAQPARDGAAPGGDDPASRLDDDAVAAVHMDAAVPPAVGSSSGGADAAEPDVADARAASALVPSAEPFAPAAAESVAISAERAATVAEVAEAPPTRTTAGEAVSPPTAPVAAPPSESASAPPAGARRPRPRLAVVRPAALPTSSTTPPVAGSVDAPRRGPFGRSSARDPRLPPVGATLTRTYKGVTYVVTLLDRGVHCQDRAWSSLSALARAITGQSVNGLLFFKVTRAAPRPVHAPTAAGERLVPTPGPGLAVLRALARRLAAGPFVPDALSALHATVSALPPADDQLPVPTLTLAASPAVAAHQLAAAAHACAAALALLAPPDAGWTVVHAVLADGAHALRVASSTEREADHAAARSVLQALAECLSPPANTPASSSP